MGNEKRKTIQVEVAKLKEAGFVSEVTYITWLANVVMVKRASGNVH